jgi:hypothetical protein
MVPGAVRLVGRTAAVAMRLEGWPLLRHVWPTFVLVAPTGRVGQYCHDAGNWAGVEGGNSKARHGSAGRAGKDGVQCY